MGLAVTITGAAPEQRAALEDLMRRSSLHWEAYRDDLLGHPDAIAVAAADIAGGHVRIAGDGAGTLLGFSCVLPRPGGVHELDGLFVDPPAMGLGIGRALIRDAALRARATGAARLSVISGPEAIGFYERVGFVRGPETPTRFGPAWRLHLMI